MPDLPPPPPRTPLPALNDRYREPLERRARELSQQKLRHDGEVRTLAQRLETLTHDALDVLEEHMLERLEVSPGTAEYEKTQTRAQNAAGTVLKAQIRVDEGIMRERHRTDVLDALKERIALAESARRLSSPAAASEPSDEPGPSTPLIDQDG